MEKASPLTIPSEAILWIDTPSAMEQLARQCMNAKALALDVEANGLFAYRPKLCTIQIAFTDNTIQSGASNMRVAIVDTLRAPLDALRPVLDENGPLKVLHDLALDARMLAEANAPLDRVHDTSIAARMLGFKASGLSSMLESEFSIKIDKRFQQHNWAERPVDPEKLQYLASDVFHLLELDEHLQRKARALDIEEEIAEECSYRLSTARKPPAKIKPAYARIKGVFTLDAPGKAILRELVGVRDKAAEKSDLPPFRIGSNDLLLEIARKKPASLQALRALLLASAGAARTAPMAEAFYEALRKGLEEGDVPLEERALFEPERISRPAVLHRKVLETRLFAWRRAEAERRGIDVQVVLPGHCAHALVGIMARFDPHSNELLDAMAGMVGMGARRLARYGPDFKRIAIEVLDRVRHELGSDQIIFRGAQDSIEDEADE